MYVCGFSIAYNAVRLGYQIEPSLRSMLPLVDELILNVGEGDEETWDLVQRMHEPKIKPFRSRWDFNLTHGGELLSQQTNLALERCRGDWALYLQSDEVLHEQDFGRIRQAMEDHLNDSSEALRFRYHHFYGSFQTVQDHPERWYTRAARAVKLGIGLVSCGDAMDFCVRRHGREWFPRQADVAAYIYHYGWVRPPDLMRAKNEIANRLGYGGEWLTKPRQKNNEEPASGRNGTSKEVYWELGNLRFFRGTHPAAMRETIARQDWAFDHGIDRQAPDWFRHGCLWADHQRRRVLPVASYLGQRLKLALLERKTPPPELKDRVDE